MTAVRTECDHILSEVAEQSQHGQTAIKWQSILVGKHRLNAKIQKAVNNLP